MFTGLVSDVGTIVSMETRGELRRIRRTADRHPGNADLLIRGIPVKHQ